MRNTIANELKPMLIVGGGRMGQAIAQGILHIDGMSADMLTVANPGLEKRMKSSATLACARLRMPRPACPRAASSSR